MTFEQIVMNDTLSVRVQVIFRKAQQSTENIFTSKIYSQSKKYSTTRFLTIKLSLWESYNM